MIDDDLDSLKTSGEEIKGTTYGNSTRLSIDLIKKIVDFSTVMKEKHVFQFCHPAIEEWDQLEYSTVHSRPDCLARCENSEKI